uniref:Uncharacterized protein n=1 Tax=Anopheles atroparvus TaxID=41427 RepID=A0A182JL26_ANOAO
LVVSFTSRSVDLSWAHSQDPRNAPVTNFIIETRIGENGDWEQEPPIHTKSSQASYQVTGLQPFTVYSFRVIAVNQLGQSQPSKESYYFVTLREAPTGKPVTTIAHNTSATSVYISWKAPPPESILGEFLGYRITFRARDHHTDDVKEIYIRDSTVEVRTTKFDLLTSAGASRAFALPPVLGLRTGREEKSIGRMHGRTVRCKGLANPARMALHQLLLVTRVAIGLDGLQATVIAIAVLHMTRHCRDSACSHTCTHTNRSHSSVNYPIYNCSPLQSRKFAESFLGPECYMPRTGGTGEGKSN